MRELELIGLHEDGEHLLLACGDEQFLLQVNEVLRAAVRRDRPALNALQAQEKSTLTPREIQKLLRSGLTAEAIAESSGSAVEHIRRYEGPVLAEREFTAKRASGFAVNRSNKTPLREVVEQRLRDRDAVSGPFWDAWKRSENTWTLSLRFTAGGREREALWMTDLYRQLNVAENDEARWISEEEPNGDDALLLRSRVGSSRSIVYDVEADGGVHSTGQVPQIAPINSQVADENANSNPKAEVQSKNDPEPANSPWVSLADDAAGEVPATADRDQLDAQPSSSTTAFSGDEIDPFVTADLHEIRSSLDYIPASERKRLAEAGTNNPLRSNDFSATAEELSAADASDIDAALDDEEPTLPSFTPPAPTEEKKKKSKRSSIPSWDEIVFGSGKKH